MVPSNMSMAVCIDLLGLRNRYKIADRQSYNVCPVCGDPNKPKKKKMSINFQKGMFRCNKCGFSGGILDFWAYHRGIPKQEASKDFWKTYHDVYESGASRDKRKPPKPVPRQLEEETPIDIKHVDSVYREFLNMLCLSKEHKMNLVKRGLSPEAIEKGLYRTVPLAAIKSIPLKLLENGHDLNGVPGFYMEKGQWKFLRYGEGFLIPSLDLDGRVCALQLRRDVAKPETPRYMTVSTDGYEKGTKGIAAPSFNPGDRDLSKVIITEGALKGNIISSLTGYPTLSVLGVNSTSCLPTILKELKKKGTSQVKIAFDMDYIGNKHVEEACDRLEEMIYRLGLRYSRVLWDPKKDRKSGALLYKGLDDYLAARK